MWVIPHRRAWLILSLLVVGLGIAGIGGRAIQVTANFPRAVTPESGGLYVGAEEIGSGEFLPRTVRLTTWHEGEARGRLALRAHVPRSRLARWPRHCLARQSGHPTTIRWLPLDQRRRHRRRGHSQRSSPSTSSPLPAGGPGWMTNRCRLPPAPWIESQAIQPGFLLVDRAPGGPPRRHPLWPQHPSPGRRHHLLARLPRPRRLGLPRQPPPAPHHATASLSAAPAWSLPSVCIIVSVRLLLPLWPPPADHPPQRIIVTNLIEDSPRRARDSPLTNRQRPWAPTASSTSAISRSTPRIVPCGTWGHGRAAG